MIQANKIVLITGASRGIGRETAISFAKEGAKVIINYKTDKVGAEETAKLAGEESCMIVQADVSSESDVKKMVAEVMKIFGRIDVLVNNAGEILRPSEWTCDLKTWHAGIDTNLTGAWLMIREVAPIMLKQKSGNIVNVTSTVGMAGVAKILPYACAKGALITLTKAMAKELSPNIRVNAVAPSNVMTSMTRSAGTDLIEKFKISTPLQRIAKPEELANAILFLSSDKASYITGEVLVVDGGYSLK